MSEPQAAQLPGLPLDEVRPIRDEIDQRVRGLLAELTTPQENSGL